MERVEIHHPDTQQTAHVDPGAVTSWAQRGWKKGPLKQTRKSSRSTASTSTATTEEN